MIKKIFTLIYLTILICPSFSQERGEEPSLRREVTLYNPYIPSIPDVRKKGFLPDIVDTLTLRPSFNYQIIPVQYSPEYSISPIRPAALLPDPLPRLYKSYVKLGLGNNNTPLAELSITNERSKKGALGLYARHYSSNGKVPLENKQKVYAGFMDNEASLFGKKFFRRSLLDASFDFNQKTRYAYGYDTEIGLYEPDRKDIRLDYYNMGGGISYSSTTTDSSDFLYNFGIYYNYFNHKPKKSMNHIAFNGSLATLFEGFYLGSDIRLDSYTMSDTLNLEPEYVFSVSPFVKKSSGQWNFDLGLELLLDKNLSTSPSFHVYPDVNFGFTVIPEYMSFFAGLGGKLLQNNPLSVIKENPYLVPDDATLFRLPNTSHTISIKAGLKGNNGIKGNYLASVEYSKFENMLFYGNVVFPDTASRIERGNHFLPVTSNGDLLNVHGELTGSITKRLRFNAAANYYNYTFLKNEDPIISDFAWNKPEWDVKLGLNYNLRDKILATAEVTATGPRKLLTRKSATGWLTTASHPVDQPAHVNLGIGAEYRYTKILSLWAKVNNISYQRYYEWAFYPSQMFNFLVGFTYSL